ncbi:MurR/RpiR family transcriptional regulator [Herbaspirillum huttiense]|uniref:MurR/RpiR family transcriptional regulator n=1 Tax=Herbaspirillum huttiense TaxID=863372 RepID=UPI0031E16B7E
MPTFHSRTLPHKTSASHRIGMILAPWHFLFFTYFQIDMAIAPHKKSKASASIESRIAEQYDQLSEIDLRLADVILSAPGQLAMQTATELAESAQVSKATATRFFQKLGYASYDDARESARAALVGGSPLYLLKRGEKQAGSGLDASIEAHLNHEVSNLANTYRSLDQQALTEAVSCIANAQRVAIIGYRHSHTIAQMIRRELVQVRSNVLVLPAPGDTLAEYLSDLGERDMAIVIGLRRRVPAISLAMDALSESGVKTLYLSDVITGKPARRADWVIRCHTDGMMLFDSVVAVSAMVNLICSLTAEKLRERGNGHLQRVEVLHQKMKELE